MTGLLQWPWEWVEPLMLCPEQAEIPGTWFLNSRDAYPLFTSMIPPLEEQNQLLPHNLVAKIKQHNKLLWHTQEIMQSAPLETSYSTRDSQ